MNPFYFGASADPLYGVYHPPREERRMQAAVLLCYPMGIEYMRAHRAFRQLTSLLVRAGVHVLRFDYHGTGDSAGDGEDVSLARWRADVGIAFEELRENAGVERAAIAGLRLGASLAALLASDRDDVSRLVLWDPVVRGTEYLRELRRYADTPMRTNGSGTDAPWPDGTVGVGGFALPASLREELRALDLTMLRPPRIPIDVVTSEERDIDRELVRTWTEAGARTELRCVHSANQWIEGDEFGSALIPQNIIQAVVDGLTRETA